MPRGGRREGAGRKPGSKLTKSALIAAEARDAGISPLEVQLTTMRELWQRANAGPKMDAELAREACAIAKDCAQFVHPRLSTVEASLTVEDRNNSAQLYEVLSRMSPSERAAVRASFELLRQRMLAPPVIDVTNG